MNKPPDICPQELRPERIIGVAWRYYHVANRCKGRPLCLLPGGSIGDYTHKNESRWAIVDNDLCLFSEDGGLTVRFSDVSLVSGKLLLSGPYIQAPGIILCLEEVGTVASNAPMPGYVKKSVVENKRSLKDAGTTITEILPDLIVGLPASMILSNLSETNPPFAKSMDSVVYCERSARISAINLVALPKGAILYGGGHYLLDVQGSLIDEQYPPYIGTRVKSTADITQIARPVEKVPGDMMLVARYGMATWGHWIGELLPKVVLVEDRYPNRYKYVLPRHLVEKTGGNTPWSRIQESLLACGIGNDRVFFVDERFNYEFCSLSAVSSIWSDHVMHPGASKALRDALQYIVPEKDKKVGIIRDPKFGRMLKNAEEIHVALMDSGFKLHQMDSLEFIQQVSIFKGAERVFGVLGSDLVNLIFSPSGVQVITAAPDVFGDRFFYALILDRKGQLADLRGAVSEPNVVMHKSSFMIHMDVLGKSLTAMDSWQQVQP